MYLLSDGDSLGISGSVCLGSLSEGGSGWAVSRIDICGDSSGYDGVVPVRSPSLSDSSESEDWKDGCE